MKYTLLLISILVISLNSCKEELCEDTCFWPADGECDDGGPNSVTDYCEYGTDCADCGTRTEQ